MLIFVFHLIHFINTNLDKLNFSGSWFSLFQCVCGGGGGGINQLIQITLMSCQGERDNPIRPSELGKLIIRLYLTESLHNLAVH